VLSPDRQADPLGQKRAKQGLTSGDLTWLIDRFRSKCRFSVAYESRESGNWNKSAITSTLITITISNKNQYDSSLRRSGAWGINN
jgi:hypothetical protein